MIRYLGDEMGKVKVSFDFDETISGSGEHIEHICQILRNHILHGDDVMILTARDPGHEEPEWIMANNPQRIVLMERLKSLGIDHLQVVYTSHEPKGPHAARLGVHIHYDNNPDEIVSCREFGVIGIPIGSEHENLADG
jgi:acid phosphatase class B